MAKLLKYFFFSRVLLALMIATDLPFLYLPSFLAAWWTLLGFSMKRRLSSMSLDPLSLLLAGITLIFLTLPRVVYFLEWLPGNSVLAGWDDFARLAELVSMTLSERYPLLHPCNQTFLLSFYYAGLYPMALVKFILPVLSLKDCIGIGNFLYHLLILLSVVEVAHLFFPRRPASIRWFVFLVALFGGLDWWMFPLSSIDHFEWWQWGYHANTQVSALHQGMFWVIHHFLAFYAVVLAYAFLFYSRSQPRWIKTPVLLLLMASAFYTSPFGIIALPLFLLPHGKVLWNKFIKSWWLLPVGLAMLVPLYIFFGKLPGTTFIASTFRLEWTHRFWLDKLLSAPVYFTLVPVIEYAGIPFFLLFALKKMTRTERLYFWMAVLFFALTYLVAFSGYNNFSMRGMFLPSFVFFFLFAKYVPAILDRVGFHRKMVYAGVVLLVGGMGIVGTTKEFLCKLQVAKQNSRIFYLWKHAPVPEKLRNNYPALARDNSKVKLKTFPRPGSHFDDYNAEKFLDSLDINQMEYWETEILRFPRKGFSR
jgi:hypothetical protein